MRRSRRDVAGCLSRLFNPMSGLAMEGSPTIAFQPFSPSHFAVLGVFALCAVTMVVLTRAGWLRTVRVMELLLAAVLLFEWPFNLWVAWRYEFLEAGNMLPLHLCDLAALLGAVALVTRQAEACELVYFWGLAGTLQGLITPSLTLDWPHPRFVMFFLLHGGVVLAAMQVVVGRGIFPRSGAALRAVAWLAVYGVVVGLIDALIHKLGGVANYGFLCHKPETASLYDHLGPWPWYLGTVMALSFVFFSVLDLPFLIIRRRRKLGGRTEEAALLGKRS